jgi:hypothetical protein
MKFHVSLLKCYQRKLLQETGSHIPQYSFWIHNRCLQWKSYETPKYNTQT